MGQGMGLGRRRVGWVGENIKEMGKSGLWVRIEEKGNEALSWSA